MSVISSLVNPNSLPLRAWLLAGGTLLAACNGPTKTADNPTTTPSEPAVTILQHVNLVDGVAPTLRRDVTVLIQDSLITAIGPADSVRVPAGARVVDLQGQTIMPTLVDAHLHVGLLQGTQTKPAYYTRANVERHLRRYQQYGVGAVLSLGTDQDSVTTYRALSRRGQLAGARLFTAVHGIGVPQGAPPIDSGADKVFRPTTAEEARAAVRELARQRADIIKIWVDDMDGKLPKMKPEIYAAVLAEAKQQQLRVAAHVYYLADAKKLVADGVSVLAHSIRDQEVDAALLQAMKARGVVYIPTLTLDQYKFAYADGEPAWFANPFFRRALEPGVLDTLQSAAFRAKSQKEKPRQERAFNMALRNLKKIHDAGITVLLGTDSGAEAIRVQGFSEHLEMQDMVRAGLTPAQVLTCATRNGASFLPWGDQHGTLAPGKFADFIILGGNPLDDIRNTQKIKSVWQAGRQVAGPVE